MNKFKLEPKTNKFKPNNISELEQLVNDLSIHLGEIDTSYIVDFSGLFQQSVRIYNEHFNGIETWNVSNGQYFNSMFYECSYFNQDLSNWNVSNGKDFSFMFTRCENFNQNINAWNVSKAEDMSFMFAHCKEFNQPLDKWNVSNVEDFSFMFLRCISFNQPLNSWDVSKGKNFLGMFNICNKFRVDNLFSGVNFKQLGLGGRI